MATTPTRIEGDMYVYGNLASKTFSPPSGSITNAAIAAGAAIDPLKMLHQHRLTYSQPNTTATTETRVLYCCRGATGTIVQFECGSIVANIGAATVTIDLKKNGTTVLSAVITLNNANAAYVPATGTLSVTSLVDGDVLTAVITATAGGGTLATGLYCSLTVHEDPQ